MLTEINGVIPSLHKALIGSLLPDWSLPSHSSDHFLFQCETKRLMIFGLTACAGVIPLAMIAVSIRVIRFHDA
jgi:hypothetical protein